MCVVFEPNHCLQCGSHSSSFNQDHRSGGYETACGRCGRREDHTLEFDGEGTYTGFAHKVRKGFGLLFFRSVGGHEFYSHSLNTPKEVLDSELWLRQRLRTGAVDAATASLSRWNDETRQVEVIVGQLVDILAGRVVRSSGLPSDIERDNLRSQTDQRPSNA